MPPPALLPTLRKPPPAPPNSGTGHSDGFNLKFAEASGADAVTAAFWSAVSIDATQVEEGRRLPTSPVHRCGRKVNRICSNPCGRK